MVVTFHIQYESIIIHKRDFNGTYQFRLNTMIYVMIIIRVCYLYRIEHVIGRGDLPYELCWRSSDVRERAGSSLPGSRARRAVQARLRCGQRQYHDQHQYSHCDTITLSTNQLLFINIYYLHLPTTIKHRNSFKNISVSITLCCIQVKLSPLIVMIFRHISLYVIMVNINYGSTNSLCFKPANYFKRASYLRDLIYFFL